MSHYLGNRLGAFTDLHWGRFGVVHFFVLSGFLISSILLRNREKSFELPAAKRGILVNFYIRRFLRIFPVYYLTIFILYARDYEYAVDNMSWLLTYTSNIGVGFFDARLGRGSHFWSLCVEEQFYLLYPFTILFIKRTRIPWVLGGLIVGSMIYKYTLAEAGYAWQASNFNLPGCLDALCLGGLLAYFHVYHDEHKRALRVLLWIGLLVGVPLLIGLQIYKIASIPVTWKQVTIYKTLVDLSISLPSLLLIHFAARNTNWIPGWVFSLPSLRYIGKISYGGYVFHTFVPLLMLRTDLTTRFMVYTLISLGIASLSWHLFEEPINNLKKHVPYLRKRQRTRQAVTVS